MRFELGAGQRSATALCSSLGAGEAIKAAEPIAFGARGLEVGEDR